MSHAKGGCSCVNNQKLDGKEETLFKNCYTEIVPQETQNLATKHPHQGSKVYRTKYIRSQVWLEKVTFETGFFFLNLPSPFESAPASNKQCNRKPYFLHDSKTLLLRRNFSMHTNSLVLCFSICSRRSYLLHKSKS